MIILSHFFMVLGLIIILTGLIGIVVFPDLFLRLHALSKVGTSGTGTFIIGLAINSNRFDIAVKLGLILVFLFITSPLISHSIAVSAVKNKIDFFTGNRR